MIRTIATGGMAHVYEAVAQGEAGFERRVALKRILPELAGDARLQRMFLDEARIASHLHHGNIVQVLDYGKVDETEFIAMEYVDGVDAHRAATRREPFPESLALHVTSEVAHALAHAHEKRDDAGQPLGIVHRDVSPQNVLLSWDGDVKLADFGIAKAATRLEKTRTGIVKGKLSYMAPEQAAGESVGPPADVYGLGATLHALITGRSPTSDPGGTAISSDVAGLVSACMRTTPGDRPTAEEVALEAGRLASQRLERDARGALREWLAPLRDQGKMSALDDLMGLVLTTHEDGGERKFTVERLAVADTVPADPPRPDQDTSVELPENRRGIYATAAFVALIAAGAALVIWGTGTTHEPSGEAQEASAQVETEPAVVPVRVPDLPTGVDLADQALPAIDAPDTGTATAATRRRRSRQSGAAMETAAETSMEATAAATMEAEAVAATGVLRVRRLGSTQESIEVDGRARGFTPRVLTLPVGEHRVVVRDAASGEVMLERRVELAAHHTRVAPLSL